MNLGCPDDDTDCTLLEETFEQEFENLKIQQMGVSVPGLLPWDKRPKLTDPNWDKRCGRVPGWVIGVHVAFMTWTIINAHYPAIFLSPACSFLSAFPMAPGPSKTR